jgi:hypothetical protein
MLKLGRSPRVPLRDGLRLLTAQRPKGWLGNGAPYSGL